MPAGPLRNPGFFPHVPRREFLRAGALSLFGLGLPTVLKASEERPRRAKSCIVLFMWGGPAQQDTWDMKPDAPDVYRGEFKPIPTAVPGLRVCEHLPLLAKRANDLCLIRSMTHADVNHLTATHHLLTGKPAPAGPISGDWPNYGAVVSKLGRGKGPLPPYVSMMPVVPNGAPRFVEESHGQGAGILGPVFNPMRIDADASKPDYRVGDFSLGADLDEVRLRGRQGLIESLQSQVRKAEGDPQLEAMGGHYRRAFSLLAKPEVTRAFDITQEPLRVRERYGMNVHGQSVLQARRLVEAGVPLVTVFWPNDGITNVSVYWDTHSRNFIDLKTRLCPVTDLAFSALLDDLRDRGMLDDTLVVWTGEMGRTPKVGQAVVGGAGRGEGRPRPLGQGVHQRAGRRRGEGRDGVRLQRQVRVRTGDEPDDARRPRRHGLSPPRCRSADRDPRPPRPPADAVRRAGAGRAHSVERGLSPLAA